MHVKVFNCKANTIVVVIILSFFVLLVETEKIFCTILPEGGGMLFARYILTLAGYVFRHFFRQL